MDKVQEQLNETSDEDNEINSLTVNRTRKLKILDSDSDSEMNAPPETRLDERATSEAPTDQENLTETTHLELKRSTKIITDSEASDDEITPHNKSFPDEETAVEAVVYTTNNKGELVLEEGPTNSIQKPRWSALCDSPSSEDEETVIKPIAYKPRRKRNNEEKPKKMTAQDAAKQRTEIQSDSQRRVRETNVSLPYHKPKSYTLKEFLEKRAKLTSALPLIPKAPPSVAMKMTKDTLLEVSKKLDERIKQVEEFYKSESEEDNEEEERESAAKEIRSWLDLLVDNAVNSAEAKNEETEEKSEAPNQFSMDYEFSLDDINEDESSKRANIAELLNEELLHAQPKLTGGPDDIIDLDKGIARPNEVKKLVEKFFQNAVRKLPQKHKVHLNIVGVSGGGEIVKETVSMNVDEEEEEPVLMETPGAKLQKLREELQIQMAKRRSELWKQKQEQGECLDVEKKANSEDEAAEKDILDDDEEEEMEMTETESEDEEECTVHSEKLKPKSAYIEDEASVDDAEEENEKLEADDDEEEDDDVNDADDNDGFDGDDEEIEETASESPRKKTLKRILKPFREDSDEEEEEPSKDITVVRTTKKANNSSDEEEVIPPNLPRVDITPQRPQPDNHKTDFDFLTPVSFLTGLQNLNSDSKFLKDSPVVSNNEESPFKEPSLQKKLFSDPSDQSQDSQSNIEDLASMICSGKFPQTQDASLEGKTSEEMVPSTQDLLDVCSGGFSDLAATSSETVVIKTKPDQEIKNLDEDYGQIISQLLDEDELERFKRKFESPVANATQKKDSFEDTEEVNATGLIDSDDEDGLEIKTKKKQKKLVFSDDDESSDEEEGPGVVENEEEIDLHDSDDEEQKLENEIRAQESANYKASDFLDKEAELSESEWGSADEDEKDLDDLEFEQGDQEVFNETKVRSELERIHMRQVLDEDNREVKLLQELLLEDGEMHGSGRQRQFRWKALDSMENSEFEKRDDDDIYLEEEEESEEQWRKMRHKREMFLKQKSTAEDVDSILSDSQIFKIGQVFKSSQSFSPLNNTPVEKTEAVAKEPFSLLSKRGSFLSRKDQVLQRLAEYNKVNETVAGTTAKNSRCFVFQTVETTAEITLIKDNNNKRKATDGTPAAIKKLRLSDLSPAVNKKSGGKPSRAKKLFGNW